MIQEAIKQLWRAQTRSDATNAIDLLDRCLDDPLVALSGIEFEGVMGIIKAKGRKLNQIRGK